MNIFAGGAAEVASLGITFLNLDTSGHLMKLSQMQKTYCRFRMININHGHYLEEYFASGAEKFDPPTKKPVNEIQKIAGKQYTNMERYRVAFDIFEVSFVKVVLYMASWLVKVVSFIFLSIAIRRKNLTKATCYFISTGQKVHIIFLNSVALDLIPYAQRTLF